MPACVEQYLTHVWISSVCGALVRDAGLSRPIVLIRTTPFPGELIHGYRGRLMRSNGVSDDKQLDTLIRAWAGVAGSGYREVPSAVLFAKVAGVPVTEFVSQHSFVSLRRAITWFHPETAHGCESMLQLLWSGPMHLPRDGAYLCEHCVAEDIESHGMSYWRRGHQLPGVFWCDKHRAPLCYVEKESAFQRPPSEFVETATRLSPGWVEELIGNPYLQKYADVCSGLLERDRPFDVAVVSHVLKAEARAQGFQASGRPVKRPLLSDMAIKVIGRQWLATVVPALANKPEGDISYQVDGVCYLKKSSSSAAAYALVCALLYSSAGVAINALAEVRPQDLGIRRKRRAELSTDDLIEAYIQSRGDYARAAERFDCVYQTVASRYATLGFPNFSGKRGARLFDAAIAFYVEEKSWNESIAAGRITPGEMENMVRRSGSALGCALREICVSHPPETAAKRPRRLSPKEAQELPEAMPLLGMTSG